MQSELAAKGVLGTTRRGYSTRRRFGWGQAIVTVILFITLVMTLFPFVYMLYGSLKDQSQWEHDKLLPGWPLHPENYSAAWKVTRRYILNSLFVSLTTVVGVQVIGSLSGWVFARFNFPGKNLLFMMILGLMMIPSILVLVTQFVIAFRLGLYDSLWGLILFNVQGYQVMAIFILRSYFAGLPEELFEAARIDGANEIQNYLNIGLPLSSSILATVGVMNFLGAWNDFIWPYLIIRSEEKYTITIGMLAFQTQYLTSYGGQYAGYVLCSLPLLIMFIFMSRTYVRGLLSGAIKL